MGSEGAGGFAAVAQTLDGIRADAVEEPVANSAGGRPLHGDERSVDQSTHDVDGGILGDAESVQDLFDTFEWRSTDEAGDGPEAALVVGEEEVVAPRDRGAEGPLAFRTAIRRVP